MCSPEAGTWGSSENILEKRVYGWQKGVIAGTSCLSKLSSIRKHFWAAQRCEGRGVALSAWHYGDIEC